MKKLSGVHWVKFFPGRNSIQDLRNPFRESVMGFLNSLKHAGAKVIVSATLRPPERADLMHWSWKISRQLIRPSAVPPMEGVHIEWDHKNDVKSLQEATSMVAAFGMNRLHVAPALRSRHTEGNAIDMNISWFGDLKIREKNNKIVIIRIPPYDGMNNDLHHVAKIYGVIKYHGGIKDRPHWSSDGR